MKYFYHTLGFILLAALAQHCLAEEREKSPGNLTYYNFSDLINKADRIMLGEIGEKKDGAYNIKAIETLKGPARDIKKITPDMYKRAEELLAKDKSDVPALPKRETEIENIDVAVIPPADNMLPKAGVQAIFFLWDSVKQEEGKPPTYKLDHPQCLYDSAVLPQIRAALFKPRSVSDGRFLREGDRRAADRVALRKADEELKKAPAGQPVLGMTLQAYLAQLLLKGDNSFQVTTHLINGFSKEVMAYDGPAGAYGVILTAENTPPESGIVLRLGGFEGVDNATLSITSITDFESVEGNKLLSKDHLFDAKTFPALKTLSGNYLMKAFYVNMKDGLKSGLNAPAWMGTVVAKEIPITFKKSAQ